MGAAADPDAAQRPCRLGASQRARRVPDQPHADRRRPRDSHDDRLSPGTVVYRFPVGVGKPGTPTPAGHFWITESGDFLADPFYGPYQFATSDYSTLSEWPGGGVVGIHGTNEPSLIPGDPSHGCIRMLNQDVLKLKPIIQIGTPLLVKLGLRRVGDVVGMVSFRSAVACSGDLAMLGRLVCLVRHARLARLARVAGPAG